MNDLHAHERGHGHDHAYGDVHDHDRDYDDDHAYVRRRASLQFLRRRGDDDVRHSTRGYDYDPLLHHHGHETGTCR